MTAPPPHLPLTDRLRSWVVPGRFYLWDKLRRELSHGEPEMRLLPFLADPARVSLDVGSFKGVYAYALIPHSAAVHAFEPNPSVYALLKRRLDGLAGKVVTHPIALSNVTGASELRVPNRERAFTHSRATLSEVAVTENFTSTPIRTARLDDLGIMNVGFIKIDAEGFERFVLEGARATIARDRPNMLIELEERHTQVPLAEMVAFVCALGYECLVLLNGVLTPFATFAKVRDDGAAAGGKAAVNNFIFLPIGPYSSTTGGTSR